MSDIRVFTVQKLRSVC